MVDSVKASLNVFMNGLLVGRLNKLRSGGLTFNYDSQWLITAAARPISLSMPLTTQTYQGDQVFNFFDNLLPDNDVIRTRIQALWQAPSKQPFDLLAQIGHDCVGAIQLCAVDTEISTHAIQAQPLNDQQIADLLKNYQQAPLGMNSTIDFRISIAGAQEKTALLWQNGRWHRPLGNTPTTHIFKLPIGFIEHQHLDLRDSCENEWLCGKIAEAFGLPVAAAEIHQFNNTKVLIVERFDRKISPDNTWIMRLPQEDMCQALGYPSALKYQADGGPGINEIMSFLLGSEQANEDRERFYRYQILFWLLAAIDGHAKNFSVFIGPGGRFQLTPLYDVMSAYPLIAKKQLQKQKIKMAMALKGANSHYHWDKVQYKYFLSTAKAVKFSPLQAQRILDEMLIQVDSVTQTVSSQLPADFPNSIAEPILSGMLSCRHKIRNIR